MINVGSIWRKWDLHIHTPASYEWKGKKFNRQNEAEKKQICQQILDKLNEVDVSAFCIMDYWTFDGYFALKSYIDENPAITSKTIFPGIELRLAAPTDYRLNTHVLFDEETSVDNLNHFLSALRMSLTSKPLSRENFIDAAKSYDDGKLRTHGFKPEDKNDDDKMHTLGLKTVEISRESLEKAIEIVGEDKCILIQPYDTSDGLEKLDWKRHPFTDNQLMKWANAFETRNPLHVDLFLGKGHPTKENVGREFLQNLGGFPKPAFSGSDAHSIGDYGVYPSQRITWLKAQPSFQGIRQVCNEPTLRCFIGLKPPKLEHVEQNPTKYMRKISIKKVADEIDEDWFDNVYVELNPGLIAIMVIRVVVRVRWLIL